MLKAHQAASRRILSKLSNGTSRILGRQPPPGNHLVVVLRADAGLLEFRDAPRDYGY